MTVTVEVLDGVPRDGELKADLEGFLRARLGVAVEVELTGPGGTAALTGIERRQKPIRLIHESNGPPEGG